MASLQIDSSLAARILEWAASQNCSVDALLESWLKAPPVPRQDDVPKEERIYRAILETAQEGIWVLDSSLRTMYINPHAAAMLNCESAAILGRPVLDFTDRDDLEKARRLLEQRQQDSRGQQGHDLRFRGCDGTVVWCIAVITPLLDGQGQQQATLLMLADVTERKRAEDALRHSETRLRSLVEAQNAFVIRTDMQGFLTYANPRFLEAFEMTLAEALGSFSLDTIVEEDWEKTRQAVDECLLDPGKPVQVLLHKKAPRNASLWSLWEFTCLVDENGSPSEIQCIGVDMSEQIKAYEALRQSQAEQERLNLILRREQEWNATVNRMLKIISHELRTPLATIKLACEFIRRYRERLDSAACLQRIQSIDHQVERINQMIDEVAQVIKGIQEGASFKPRLANLERLCQMITNELQDSLGGDHQLSFVSDGCIHQAVIDEMLVSRILLNLLSNAIRYSPTGSSVRLELREDDGQAVLSVSDEGIGIAAEERERIFEPFYRAPNAQSISGTGLGLNIVKECVTLHGGTISVTSAVGKGSTFTVRLPLK